MITKRPTFQYWDTVLNMEILDLISVRAHREQISPLYVESLNALVPCFFALDRHNYDIWIPVHIRDMESLPASIHKEFEEHDNWVVLKTTHRLSSIDQTREQNDELVKRSGRIPRRSKVFDQEYISDDGNKQHHHEEVMSTQKIFKEWLSCTPSVG